ncbi:MAG: hypothetical protein U0Q16_05825 [Bryobacteraceae bacterium]
MLRRRRRHAPTGFFHFSSTQYRSVSGFGDGEHIRLKDEQGNVWRGTAEVLEDNTVRYRFRNAEGRTISGVADGYGILLRDDRGQVWRGYVY